jgi:hypothetical protein
MALEDEFGDEFLDIDIDIDDDISDDKLEIVEGAVPKRAEATPSDMAVQDVDLADFGDFETVTPTADAVAGEDLPEVRDLPEIAALDEDPFLGDDEGFFEEEVFDEPLEPIQDEGPVVLDLEPDDHTDMEHILALEEDLTSGIRPQAAAQAPATPAPEPAAAPDAERPDRAAEILGKIEQELSSIKREISDLKKEVTHLRDLPRESSAPAAVPAQAAAEAPAETEEPKSHGFFDEEDDETIALTGDELDNILSTAEISEGEEAGVTIDGDLLTLDAEGNLVEPETAVEGETEAEVVHVTDEEFLAGTALADDEIPAGVPESIELEESLPLELDARETEDLLSAPEADFEVDPLPEGLLEGTPDALDLELPTDEELGLDAVEGTTLAPDLIDEGAAFSEELTMETLEPDLESQGDGWSAPAPEPLPPPPSVTQTAAPAAPATGGGMTQGLKDELRAVLSYMDKLLASLPDDKIQEFAESEHFEVYKRLFEELGLIE